MIGFKKPKKNRKLLFVIGGFLVLVLIWPYLVKGIQFLQAPKFKSIQYTGDEASYDCLAFVTDATCYDIYQYRATGTESEIAKKLQSELEKRGYSLGTDPSKYHVLCGTTSYDGPDKYFFERTKKGYKYPEELNVSFYIPSSSLKASEIDYEHTGYGCSNLQGDYVIRIYTQRPQK